MDNNDHIDKLTEEALNSFDGAERATPKPFLHTRIMARVQNEKENSWDNALRFISKPVVALAGLCFIVAINAVVVGYNYPQKATALTTEETYASVDEYSSPATVLNEIENVEP